MTDQLLWGGFAFCTYSRNGISQIGRRPRSNGRDQQVQAAGSMHLILVCTVTELAALAHEDGATRAVDGFTVVEPTLLPTTELWIEQEFEDEDGLLQAPCALL